MKYVMTPNQEVIVNGEYPYRGASGELLSNGKTQLIEEFLMFEHTDGLNYVHTEIAKTKYLSKYLGISDTDKIQFNALVGIGAGILYPKQRQLFKAPIISNSGAYASHHFTFNQSIIAFGGILKCN